MSNRETHAVELVSMLVSDAALWLRAEEDGASAGSLNLSWFASTKRHGALRWQHAIERQRGFRYESRDKRSA